MTIRPALADDIPEVRTMLREYVAWIGLDLAYQEIDEEIAMLPGDYEPPGGALFVAEEGHHLVGMIAFVRWVIYVPFATGESTGLPTQPSGNAPWLMFPGTAGAHIMITPPRPRQVP